MTEFTLNPEDIAIPSLLADDEDAIPPHRSKEEKAEIIRDMLQQIGMTDQELIELLGFGKDNASLAQEGENLTITYQPPDQNGGTITEPITSFLSRMPEWKLDELEQSLGGEMIKQRLNRVDEAELVEKLDTIEMLAKFLKLTQLQRKQLDITTKQLDQHRAQANTSGQAQANQLFSRQIAVLRQAFSIRQLNLGIIGQITGLFQKASGDAAGALQKALKGMLQKDFPDQVKDVSVDKNRISIKLQQQAKSDLQRDKSTIHIQDYVADTNRLREYLNQLRTMTKEMGTSLGSQLSGSTRKGTGKVKPAEDPEKLRKQQTEKGKEAEGQSVGAKQEGQEESQTRGRMAQNFLRAMRNMQQRLLRRKEVMKEGEEAATKDGQAKIKDEDEKAQKKDNTEQGKKPENPEKQGGVLSKEKEQENAGKTRGKLEILDAQSDMLRLLKDSETMREAKKAGQEINKSMKDTKGNEKINPNDRKQREEHNTNKDKDRQR